MTTFSVITEYKLKSKPGTENQSVLEVPTKKQTKTKTPFYNTDSTVSKPSADLHTTPPTPLLSPTTPLPELSDLRENYLSDEFRAS